MFKTTALRLLQENMGKKEPRYKHTLGVHRNMTTVLNSLDVSESFRDICEASSLLHDIGYAKALNKHNFHPVDGFNYVKDMYPKEIAECVLYHSFANIESKVRRPDMLSWYDHPLAEESKPVWELVTYCDLHTDGMGNLVSINSRYADIATRHGSNSDVFKYMLHIRPLADALIEKLDAETRSCFEL